MEIGCIVITYLMYSIYVSFLMYELVKTATLRGVCNKLVTTRLRARSIESLGQGEERSRHYDLYITATMFLFS